jgi:hypothetical protein
MPTQRHVLPSATDNLSHYDKRFESVDNIRDHVEQLVDEAALAVGMKAQEMAAAVRAEALEHPHGKIAPMIGRLNETHLALAFDAVQRAGLKAFVPDVRGPKQSVYNQIHRHICVSSFQFIGKMLGLGPLEVPLSLSRNYGLLCQLYDNYVYGRLTRVTSKELNNPGSLVKSQELEVIRGRRQTVGLLSRSMVLYSHILQRCVARYQMAKMMRYRKGVLRALRAPEMHSDDEYEDSTHKELIVFPKPQRSASLGLVIQDVDQHIVEAKQRKKKRGRKPVSFCSARPSLT